MKVRRNKELMEDATHCGKEQTSRSDPGALDEAGVSVSCFYVHMERKGRD